MNFILIFKIIAILLFVLGIFMIFPIFFAFYYGEIHTIYSFLITMVIIAILIFLIFIWIRGKTISKLSTRDGFLVVALSWLFASFFGSLPFFFSGYIPHFTDAFFETMSGFTTTGASILANIESLPKSLLFWRSLTHWLGGMGIVVLTVAILPLLGVGGLQLVRAESPGPSVDKLTPRIAETAKLLWGIYIFFTIAETILLMLGGLNLFESLTHTFGTLATGGFSPKNSSVGYYNSAYVDTVITVFMLLAGINFLLHFRLLTGKVKSIFSNIELKVYLSIFFIATIFITFNLYGETYKTIGKAFRFASFQSASILTTTGYATANFENWPHFAQIILFLLMFIGGCSGSTGGGIKVIRIIIFFKQALLEMKYLLHPRAIFTLKIGSQVIKKNIIYSTLGFIFLYIFMVLLTTLVVASAKQGILTSLTTALATVGNIGPGFGHIGPTENYAFFPNYVKWFLSFAMLAGRLEIYTILTIFTYTFWKQN